MIDLAIKASERRNQTRGTSTNRYFLAISGGGDDGAFGAGLLVGWSDRGDRPVFDVVTGVSTGSLSAPFVFLGQKYDAQLKEIYTQTTANDIFVRRPDSICRSRKRCCIGQRAAASHDCALPRSLDDSKNRGRIPQGTSFIHLDNQSRSRPARHLEHRGNCCEWQSESAGSHYRRAAGVGLDSCRFPTGHAGCHS